MCIRDRYDVPVICHGKEKDGILKITKITSSALKIVESGDTFQLGSQDLKIIHTPGHTPGSICILWNQNLFAGDTLFINGCGRVDLPGGNAEDLFDSLKNRLLKLDPETILYPGHAYSPQKSMKFTELIKLNPFIQNMTDKSTWLRNFG